MTINWTDKFSVEDPVIDEDHKTLINHFNKFEWAIEEALDFEILEHLFSDIEKHAVEHFKREERLMLSIDYPGLEEHKKSHQDIVARLAEIRKNIHSAKSGETDGRKVVKDIVVFINNWLNDHLIGEDHLYKPYIVKQRTYENKVDMAPDYQSDDQPDDQSDDQSEDQSDDQSNERERRSSDVSSVDRRESSDASGDRRGVKNKGRHFSIFRIVIFLVIGVIAGGIYWLYGDVGNSQQATRVAKPENITKGTASVNPSPTGLGWVSVSKCEKLPDVKWWHNPSHLKIARYVAVKNSGDWKQYIKKWSRQLNKLEDIRSNGAAALAPGGKRLEGKDLDIYITDVSKRVDIISCLADEAAAYAARGGAK